MLDHKIAFLKEQSFREARGAADVKDVLEKLKVKGAFIYPASRSFPIWQWVTIFNRSMSLTPLGESSDKDQRVLSAEDKPVQEAIGQLPDPTECHAQVIYWLLRHCFTFQVIDEKHTLFDISLFSFKPPFRFKFYFRFLQSVNREVAREVENKRVSLNMKTGFFAIRNYELAHT